MMYLNSALISIDRLAPAIAWGYIITAKHEKQTGIDRYRFEVAVRGKPLQPLVIDGHEVVNTPRLLTLLQDVGIPTETLKALNRASCEDLHHLRGSEKRTACSLAYHLPALHPKRLHLITSFLELPENEQCPRCKNLIDPSYLPVWRFREPVYQQAQPVIRRKKLPG